MSGGRPALRASGLSKLYRRMGPGFPRRTLKSALLDRDLTAGLAPDQVITAFRDVSFTVERGEAFGVIGSNGSGKSTLLKVMAGILRPSSGEISVHGSVAALIELGAGFHPEISGRENVFINGAVLGLPRREIERRFDDIVDFSGLGDFIDEPVKNYSSGMYVRLGFAVAIHTEPDVLLVDEVLAVGDEAFAHRCLRRIEEILAAGRTVVMVSHSLTLVEELCDRVLWLDRGEQRLLGSPRRVVDAYRQAVAEEEGRGHRAEKEERERRIEARGRAEAEAADGGSVGHGAGGEGAGVPPAEEDAAGPAGEAADDGTAEGEEEGEDEPRRWGDRSAEILRVRLFAGDGEERYHFASGDEVTFEIEARAESPLDDFVFGIGISTPRGVEVWGTNTQLEGLAPEHFSGEARVRLTCPSLRLAPGEYLIDVACHARDGAPYDYHERHSGFTVTASTSGVGVYFPEHEWRFAGEIRWSDDTDRREEG